MNREEIINVCRLAGFQQVGFFRPENLKFVPEVRDMCAANRCNHYGKSWMCPPGCGSLEEIAFRASTFPNGVIVQSTGAMQDDFDIETIEAVEKSHKQAFHQLVERMHICKLSFLPMGAGACSLCPDCTYPTEPCRLPDLAYPSMEAYGLVVNEVCIEADIPYYYGKGSITFTSCILWK